MIRRISYCKKIFKGILEVLGAVLDDCSEALNMMKPDHIRLIITLLEKHGRNSKVQCDSDVILPTFRLSSIEF